MKTGMIMATESTTDIDLQPVRDRGLQDVVAADMGVEGDQQPEPEERQGVGVERLSGDPRDDEIGGPGRQRGDEQPGQVVAPEPEEDGIDQSRHGAGGGVPHHVADRVDAGGPEEGGHEVPDRDVELLFRPVDDGHDRC